MGRTMKIAAGVTMLEVSMGLMGNLIRICPTLLWDDDTVLLIDAGAPLPKIRDAINAAGVPFEKLNKVILTHQDLDHIGGLPTILAQAPQKIEVLAHEAEKPYIQGDLPLIKLSAERMAQIRKQLDLLPDEQRAALKSAFENPPRAKVDRTVADGEELPYCGGVVVIHTPGHTPGHICLYHQPSKTLISGDALNVVDGGLVGPVPQYTQDLDLAVKSLQKLAKYDVANVICSHGGYYKGDANRRIAELAGNIVRDS